ncbi:MAG: hypothetical protein QF898_18390 [SAR202 cluster bacterium]|jgi:hypothetical protein|nr:hypothetical protein [SAR202 cluster bacterium]MDP6715483.1 hypothetical protein [SAR202 cluster bacterium]|tara:strand:- start:262 stop:1158 length:897 start_codon:yes stop_codon:yes gene_type:complete
MFGSAYLDIAIGLVFIYILFAVFTSTAIEYIGRILKWRSSTLQDGIRTLLNDTSGTGLAKTLYEHPLINHLSKTGKPSYIPSKSFAMALLDSIPVAEAEGKSAMEKLRAGVTQIGDEHVQKALLKLLDSAGDDLDKAHKNIESWFDDGMDRVSGWYARKVHLLGIIIAVVFTVTLNADSYMIANDISHSSALQDALVQAAGNSNITQLESQSIEQTSEALNNEIQNISLPLGWSSAAASTRTLPDDLTGWFGKVAGLLVTAFAVSLGAPFWFQTLNRIVGLRQGLRQSGPAPKTSSSN